jgi:regulator of nonsense transcripts 2
VDAEDILEEQVCLQISNQIYIVDFSKQIDERTSTPDLLIVRQPGEALGPSDEAESEFVKELAKMMAEPSNEARKVDKRTALALWDSSTVTRKKRIDQIEDMDIQEADPNQMKFTVISRRGHKQQESMIHISLFSLLSGFLTGP